MVNTKAVVLCVILTSVIFLYVVFGYIKIESNKLEEKIYADTAVNYELVKKEEFEELSSVDKELNIFGSKGNSPLLLGNFFIFSSGVTKNGETQTSSDLYYFTKSDFGLVKHHLSDTIKVDKKKNNVFYKATEEKQPFIEVKEAKFKDKVLEEKRKKFGISRTIYVIYAPKDMLDLIKCVELT
ncbi:hypothetical protein ENFAE_16940 [Enterococcus faecalis]|uniref:hypothetical protein n=1 Tax=Enterococcus faecalis TaxID=1351 RepID=UPI0008780C08|nr:hypothetical protein [Enterococcus faecalis]OFA12787.1 hypothetical protein ENFAE_16940 [Enterococcus faecalis]